MIVSSFIKLLVIMSILSFCLHRYNHVMSKKHKNYLYPESIMYTSSALFGAFGTLLYMIIFKYQLKSKIHFIPTILFLLIHIALLITFIFLEM